MQSYKLKREKRDFHLKKSGVTAANKLFLSMALAQVAYFLYFCTQTNHVWQT